VALLRDRDGAGATGSTGEQAVRELIARAQSAHAIKV
jgi:hypothetical protein